MMRDALVVGINTYTWEGLPNLRSPAEDAEAIAQRLQASGDFRVWRLPEFVDPFEAERRTARSEPVALTQLEASLVNLFKPSGETVPDTALFFFSGHGLRKDRGIQEGYLATSDVNPEQGSWGLSLQWLRRLLQESPVRQQIIWLDCCYSGELLNFEEADPGERGRSRDRSFIAASREYEAAYEATAGNHSVLTRVLLEGLNPSQRADGLVTNFTLTQFIDRSPELRGATQRPLFANSGGKIVLTSRQVVTSTTVTPGICPYKGLAYFDYDGEDPTYFHGRTALTDVLLEKVRSSNFLALVGASGSGKSSVLRAGLLHQLFLGERLSGSQRWQIQVFRPGKRPLHQLALSFLDPEQTTIDRATQLAKVEELLATGAAGLAQLANATPHRLVLVVDQFEEAFTLCQDIDQRQQFFACLLGALEQTSRKLCVVVAMRADFFGKCLERDYSGLAPLLQENLVAVTPMDRGELHQAIVEPARQVGLEIESELVTQMLVDVESSPGSLPLLQYTLTELWKHRAADWITLAAYNQLGGVRGTLQNRADEVYDSLSPGEQTAAQQIFLALTQLGEGTEDTRRQAIKQDLLSEPKTAELVDGVIEKLSRERLIVTSQLAAKGPEEPMETVDVAHEALIRHWPRLRAWVEENRLQLRQKRRLESAAEIWRSQGKSRQRADLLQGRRLVEAENFWRNRSQTILLSTDAQEFLQVSQRARWRNRAGIGLATATGVMAVAAVGWLGWQQQRQTEIFRVTTVGQVRPELLPIAQRLLPEAQRLAADGQIDQALINYRAALSFANLLTVKAEESDIDLPVDWQQVAVLAETAEAQLVQLILQERLPGLETELQQQQFGSLNYSYTDSANIDERFQDGALKTTFALLLQARGAQADSNADGLINNASEAGRLPCSLLAALEELWRRHTADQCGWYNKADYSVYAAPGCDALDSQTLTALLFEAPYDYVVAQLNSCTIAPENLSASD